MFIIYDDIDSFCEAEIIEFAYGYVIETTICIVIYLNLVINFDKISQIYDLLMNSADDKFNCKIMKIKKIFTCLWFIVLLIGTVCDFIGNIYLVELDYFNYEDSNLIVILLKLINYYYLTVGVILYAILNYTFINLIIHLKFENSIKTVGS